MKKLSSFLSLGLIGVFINRYFKRFSFWKNKTTRFLVFSLSFFIFFYLLFSILLRIREFNFLWILCVLSLIYGIIATFTSDIQE